MNRYLSEAIAQTLHVEVQPCYLTRVVSKHAIIESMSRVSETDAGPALLSSSARWASGYAFIGLLLYTSHPPRNASLVEITRSVLPLLLRIGVQCTTRWRMRCLVLRLRVRIRSHCENGCKTRHNTTPPFRTMCRGRKRRSGRMTRSLRFASPPPDLALTKENALLPFTR